MPEHTIAFHASAHPDTCPSVLSQLYGLRKKVFADRLNWKVQVRNGHEFDHYDNADATYIVGCWNGQPLAGVRLINTLRPYMVEGPFRAFFDVAPPKHPRLCESSRFFVDTERASALGLAAQPFTELLLLAMHNHAQATGMKAVVTVVSAAMSRIVRRAGWHYEVLSQGQASPGERVLLLSMPVDEANRQRLRARIGTPAGLDLTVAHFPTSAPRPLIQGLAS